MKILIHNHNYGLDAVTAEIGKDVENILTDHACSISDSTRRLRKDITQKLALKGWSDQIRISTDSRITITSTYKGIGLCFQTGNMGRFYADLLKLQTLYFRKKIKSGIFIIPTKYESKRMGSNRAHFDRLIDELAVFSEILTIPLVVYGFERSE